MRRRPEFRFALLALEDAEAVTGFDRDELEWRGVEVFTRDLRGRPPRGGGLTLVRFLHNASAGKAAEPVRALTATLAARARKAGPRC